MKKDEMTYCLANLVYDLLGKNEALKKDNKTLTENLEFWKHECDLRDNHISSLVKHNEDLKEKCEKMSPLFDPYFRIRMLEDEIEKLKLDNECYHVKLSFLKMADEKCNKKSRIIDEMNQKLKEVDTK